MDVWIFKKAHLKIYPTFWFHPDPTYQPFLLFGEEAMLWKRNSSCLAKRLQTNSYQFHGGTKSELCPLRFLRLEYLVLASMTTAPTNHSSLVSIEMETNFNIVIYLLEETPIKVTGFSGSRKLIPHSLPHLFDQKLLKSVGKNAINVQLIDGLGQHSSSLHNSMSIFSTQPKNFKGLGLINRMLMKSVKFPRMKSSKFSFHPPQSPEAQSIPVKLSSVPRARWTLRFRVRLQELLSIPTFKANTKVSSKGI